ncbi:MAG: hypothetical protein MZV63_17395 [Marinilabiliales bacterium]|nr:hypothetical protein [Marinilabiliales bacterium]
MKHPIRSRWRSYRTLCGAFSRIRYSQTWSAVQLWIGAAESWTRTFLFRQTRSLWARAADSYRRWPMNERHSPQCIPDQVTDRGRVCRPCSTSGH